MVQLDGEECLSAHATDAESPIPIAGDIVESNYWHSHGKRVMLAWLLAQTQGLASRHESEPPHDRSDAPAAAVENVLGSGPGA